MASDKFVITPEMRKSSRALALQTLRTYPSRFLRFPLTSFIDLLTVCGTPLEVIRFINGNKHKPKSWYRRAIRQVRMACDNFRLRVHVTKTEPIGSADELREFVKLFKLTKKHEATLRYQRWWFEVPFDNMLNRDIVHPKTNAHFPDGAVSIRCDDDFFVCAVIPYRFRDIPLQDLAEIIFPGIAETVLYLPDSGTPEFDAYSRIMIQMYLDSEDD